MQTTPKALRLHIGIFGRTNVGKSSFLNMVSGQDVAITSSIPGTTTDIVEKTMELLPIGPVVFLDTAGFDDASLLGEKRIERTHRAIDRADIALVLVESGVWTNVEADLVALLVEKKKPFLFIVNKTDIHEADEVFLGGLKKFSDKIVQVSSVRLEGREIAINELKRSLILMCSEDYLKPPALLEDILPSGGLIVLVVPIDLQAPKGRLILPQVQAIRDALDNDAVAVVVKDREYVALLKRLKTPPDLVVCDSQVVKKMVEDTPDNVACTTFSILLARFKGDLIELARGAAMIDQLRPGDRVLIAESCSHHATEDDIGRVKIPRWLRQYVGGDLVVDHFSGRDYPANLEDYKLVIHCGSCMLTRGEMLFRIHQAKEKGVAITNYGVGISVVQGVLKRVLSPFPAALSAYEKSQGTIVTVPHNRRMI